MCAVGKFEPLAIRLERFLSEPTARGCREFMGHRNAQGYGRIGFGRGSIFAHRAAFALANGIEPTDIGRYDICHHCDNPPCCEPSHLFLGTRRDNALDMMRKGRWGGAFGEAQHSSKLTTASVLAMRKLRAESALPYEAIGDIFGVTKAVAHKAITGRSWKHV